MIRTLKKYISNSLCILYREDMHLIMNEPYCDCVMDQFHHVGERSIVFRFAHYLQNMIEQDSCFADYVLDCEYNRNGINAKTLPSFTNGVYPDIIIHKRGSNDYNLLVIEVKTYWNSNTEHDERKLQEFVDRKGEYCFQHALSLVIGKTYNEVHQKWIDGDTDYDEARRNM